MEQTTVDENVVTPQKVDPSRADTVPTFLVVLKDMYASISTRRVTTSHSGNISLKITPITEPSIIAGVMAKHSSVEKQASPSPPLSTRMGQETVAEASRDDVAFQEKKKTQL